MERYMETETLIGAERTCKDCGTPLGAGREDRLYCDEACKTNFNNRKKRENRKAGETEQELSNAGAPEQLSVPDYIIRIQDILLNNRRILEGLCNPEKPRRVRLRDLLGKGFNKKFLTSVAEPTTSGRIYHFCFEYGYFHDDENGWVIIVLREREVD
jgi:predicted nucleic acid-binding Zn ribbon protein